MKLYINRNEFHLFEKKRNYYLFGIHNVATFEINRICYELLSIQEDFIDESILSILYQKFNPTDIMNAIKNLKEWKILISEKKFTKTYEIENPFLPVNEKYDLKMSGLYMVVSQNCNLRCKYCSAEFGKFGQNEPEMYMRISTAKKALDFLNKNKLDDRKKIITFVGGEPLLNFETIKESVLYARKLLGEDVEFSFNTNGTLLNHSMAKWFYQNKVRIRFSIDGTKEIHDNNRPFKNGSGSYDSALKGMRLYSKYEKNLLTQSSLPYGHNLIDSVHNLWRLGAKAIIPNVTSNSNFLKNVDYTMNDNDWNTYYDEWEKISEEILNMIIQGNYFPGFGIINIMISIIDSGKVRPPGCGAGSMFAVTPDEKIHLCQGFVGLNEHTIGNLDSGIDFCKRNDFGDVYIKFLDRCRNCWIKGICGSSCVAQAIQENNLESENDPTIYCEFLKKAAEYIIYMYSKIKELNPKYFS